jgi:hypothetical protein
MPKQTIVDYAASLKLLFNRFLSDPTLSSGLAADWRRFVLGNIPHTNEQKKALLKMSKKTVARIQKFFLQTVKNGGRVKFLNDRSHNELVLVVKFNDGSTGGSARPSVHSVCRFTSREGIVCRAEPNGD